MTRAVLSIIDDVAYLYANDLHPSQLDAYFQSMRITDQRGETRLVDIDFTVREPGQLELPTLKVEAARELVYLADDVHRNFSWLVDALGWLHGVREYSGELTSHWYLFHLHWAFAEMCSEEPPKELKNPSKRSAA